MKLDQGLNLDTVPVNTPPGTYPYAKNEILNDETGVLSNERGFTQLNILPSNHKFCGYIAMEGDKYIVFTHDDSGETLSDGTQRAGYVEPYDYKGNDYSIIYFTPGSDVVSGETLTEGIYKIKYNSTEYDVISKGAKSRILGSGESKQYNYAIFDMPGTTPASGSITEMDASGGVDYIGFIENNLYTAVSTSISFLFHPSFPVTGRYRYTSSGDVEAVFRDEINKPKKIVFNKNDGILEDTKDKTYMFRKLQMPAYDLEEVTGGGELMEGAYFFTIRYLYEDGGYTEAFPASHPVYVNSNKLREEGRVVNSGKRIRMKLSNLDQDFDTFELIALAKTEGVVNSYIVNQYQINSSIEHVSFTGSENLADISLEEVLVGQAVYENVQTFTDLNGILYLGNLSTAEGGDLQSRANDIAVKWTTFNPKRYEGYASSSEWLIHDGYEKPETAFYRKGFRPGETYAMYISWVKDGRLTRAYHIPGRELASLNLELDNGTIVQIPTAEIWTHKLLTGYVPTNYPGRNVDYLSDDMAVIEGGDDITTGVRYYQTRDTVSVSPTFISQDPPIATGVTSYWENEDEVYPDDFPDYAGERVRHHKIPTENYIKRAMGAFYDEGNMCTHFSLANVDTTGYDGYVIFYAKPEHTILGESMLHNDNMYYVFTNNWDTADFNSGNGRGFRFHDLGMLFDKPAPETMATDTPLCSRIQLYMMLRSW
jgi:hypothetical protein